MYSRGICVIIVEISCVNIESVVFLTGRFERLVMNRRLQKIVAWLAVMSLGLGPSVYAMECHCGNACACCGAGGAMMEAPEGCCAPQKSETIACCGETAHPQTTSVLHACQLSDMSEPDPSHCHCSFRTSHAAIARMVAYVPPEPPSSAALVPSVPAEFPQGVSEGTAGCPARLLSSAGPPRHVLHCIFLC